MSDGIQLTKKQIAGLLVGVLLMSFMGIVAGSRFVQQRTAKATKHHDMLLKKGDILPEFSLESLDGSQVDGRKLLAGSKTVLMFLHQTADIVSML